MLVPDVLVFRAERGLQFSFAKSECKGHQPNDQKMRKVLRALRSRLRGDYWLWLIILLALGLRTYHLDYPPWDYHNWRQTQTLMVARDFNRHGFKVLHPQVQWVSNLQLGKPSYFSGEFSIEAVLTALLYKLFGESDTLPRIVVITFSLFGIIFLYELLALLEGRTAARLGAFVYALLPFHIFFGRVFMPDVPALSLALGGLLFLSRWTVHRKRATLLFAAVITALAVLQKLTVMFVGLPMLYLFWRIKGRQLFARSELYWFVALVAIPSVAWYVHANAMSRQSGFAFVQPGLFGRHLKSWLEGAFIHRTLTPLWSEALSPLGLGLSLVGFFWPAGGPAFWTFRLWSAASGMLLFLIPDLLSANYYYYSLLLPAAAALSGLVLARFVSGPVTRTLLGLILTVFTIGAIRTAIPLYQDDRAPRDLGVLLNHLAHSEDLIAAESGGSPNLLYFADRRGWNVEQQYEIDLVRQLRNAGARYFADPSTLDLAQRKKFFESMDANFERLTPDQGTWPIYRLSVPPETLEELPITEIRNPLQVRLTEHVELVGASSVTLTQSPAAFQVVSFWRRLGYSANNLQRYVHVANAAGEAVYHSNLKPLAELYPKVEVALKGNDIIREQTLLVLPVSLPKGRYSIWFGWLDPERVPQGYRVDPDIRNRHNCVQVGEVQIQQTLRYGWFSPIKP
jgi:hypothetical protein